MFEEMMQALRPILEGELVRYRQGTISARHFKLTIRALMHTKFPLTRVKGVDYHTVCRMLDMTDSEVTGIMLAEI